MSDSSDSPEFGVVKGTAAAVPVAPAVPDGALALAQVRLPAGVSNTAAPGVVITQVYIGAALKGDKLLAQNSAQRDAMTNVPDGTMLHNVGDNCDYVRKDGKWKFEGPFTENNLTDKNTAVWNATHFRGTVHNGIASGIFWFNRAGNWDNAKAWESSRVIKLPDSLKTNGFDLNLPTSNREVVLQIINNDINIRPTVNRNFTKGEWFSGNFSYLLA